MIPDAHPNCGPAEALRCALEASPTDWMLFVSVDQPFLDLEVLLAQLQPDAPDVLAVVPETGRHQYLAALYHKALLPRLTEAIAKGERRLRTLIPADRTQFVPFSSSAHPDVLFFNVNTPADYLLARGRVANEARRVPVVTITAPASGTGKTTFVTRLVPRLRAAGLRVGVVKGDAHGYQLDTAGKDSARFAAAGATAVAVVSPTGYFIEQQTTERRALLDVAAHFEDVDVVLIESRAHGAFPALALWRGKGDSTPPAIAVAQFTSTCQNAAESTHSGRNADASQTQIERLHKDAPALCTYDIDDIDAAVRLVRFLCSV